jgi:hypothetical protein
LKAIWSIQFGLTSVLTGAFTLQLAASSLSVQFVVFDVLARLGLLVLVERTILMPVIHHLEKEPDRPIHTTNFDSSSNVSPGNNIYHQNIFS